MRRARQVTVVVVALLLGIAGGSGAAPQEQVIQITASEWKFEPKELTVTAGVPIQLTELNKGTTQHDFAIEALGVALPLIDPGKSSSVRFTPTKKGSFEFKCTVPGHVEAGMRGTIVVK